jgi:hypothetical protein
MLDRAMASGIDGNFDVEAFVAAINQTAGSWHGERARNVHLRTLATTQSADGDARLPASMSGRSWFAQQPVHAMPRAFGPARLPAPISFQARTSCFSGPSQIGTG